MGFVPPLYAAQAAHVNCQNPSNQLRAALLPLLQAQAAFRLPPFSHLHFIYFVQTYFWLIGAWLLFLWSQVKVSHLDILVLEQLKEQGRCRGPGLRRYVNGEEYSNKHALYSN